MTIQRRAFLQSAGATALAVSSRTFARTESSADAWERAADIARNVKPPTFPDRVFDITKFGAHA